jgi:putative glycosyltransferase
MNIVFSADNNYAAYLCIAAKSVEISNSKNKICFYVLDNGISEENKAIIAANLCNKISFIPVNPNDFLDFPLTISHISITTYARLKISEYITDCDKVLYLDIDLLVKNDLEALWNTKLDNNWIGACIDLFVDENRADYKQKIGLTEQEHYFNAGVLLINLKQWRQVDVFQMACAWVKQYNDVMEYQDQDILNGLFKGQVSYLNSRFNFMPFHGHFLKNKMQSRQQDSEYLSNICIAMPIVICHYCGTDKAWHSHCTHLNASLCMKLLNTLSNVPPEWQNKFSPVSLIQKFKRFRQDLRNKLKYHIY